MKIPALISAQAELLAFKEADGYRVTRRASREPFLLSDADLSRLLTPYTDVRQVDVSSVTEAERILEQEWRGNRAIRFFIMLFDPSEPEEGLEEVASAIASLLDDDRLSDTILNRFSGSPLPSGALTGRAVAYSEGSSRLSSLVSYVASRQVAIERVCAGYELISLSTFESEYMRDNIRSTLVDSGVFRSLVDLVFSDVPTANLQFELLKQLRTTPRYRDIASGWLSAFERVTYTRLPILEDDEEEFRAWSYGDRGPGGRQAFENALQQQRAILRQVIEGDFASARRFTNDLIRQQLAQGGTEYVAKSLTRLSQKAKELDAVELFVEWAAQAAKLNPSDPRTRGQLADALFQTGRYDEAGLEFDAAKAFGEVAYGITGRARIARALGDLNEARSIYQQIVDQFGNSRDGHYGYSGIAETYRDSGNLELALSSYEQALEHYPDEPAIKCGKAATLADMGFFEEARVLYERVLSDDGSNVVALNGGAALLKSSGQLQAALETYRSIVKNHAFDIMAHVGLVDTLRAMGNKADALNEAQRTFNAFPGSPTAWLRLATCLSEAGRYVSASQSYRKAIERFPKDVRFHLGAAAAERDGGRYDKALSLYDKAIGIFPRHRDVWLGRAHMLRRLGFIQEAYDVYRRALESNPNDMIVKNALASVLIYNGSYDEALDLVSIENPQLEEEWRSFLLHALLDYKAGYLQASFERLDWAKNRCSFARIKTGINTLQASILLQNGQARRASALLPVGDNPASNIISFHAAAAAKKIADAKRHYAVLKSSLPKQYGELRDAIAGTYQVMDRRNRRSASWIFSREAQVMSLELAA